MLKFKINILVMIVALFCASGLIAQITIDQLHGDQTWTMPGLHSGNQIRTCFYNDGMVGDRQSDELGMEWPINSGYEYLSKSATMIGGEVEVVDDSTGGIKRIIIISEGNGSSPGSLGNASSGDVDPNTGDWWTMAPLPYFANQFPEPDANGNERKKQVAMSHWPWSWPSTWPDKFDDTVDPGWAGSWNGYFGKNVLNADQESYYVMDDYQNREWPFYPDSTDLSRRGLGIRATVRQFQWSNVLVEDTFFFLYDATNIGTYEHDKMIFGTVYGPNIGIDSDDDGGAYILSENLGYQFDEDNIGSGGWTPVGLLGAAFFESPGNPFDGIDNDGDGFLGSGMVITEDTFAPKNINLGDPIILTNYSTFERTLSAMPAEGVRIKYLGREYHIKPGDLVEEIQNDLIDNNLNGLIDESNGSVFGNDDGTGEMIENFLFVGLKAVDYFSGAGLDNLLIDERRDDTIDNDGDWNILTDDVGLDGVPRTGDFGEGDGMPTSGVGTLLPGEPHIDKTDIDESDMIGLTSFNIHEPWTIYPLQDDQIIWDEAIRPGFLNERGQGGNTDIFLGSGYFPLQVGDTERFSIGDIMGYGPNEDELIRNKQYAEKTYLENYNFAKAPNLPTLKLVPGNGRVTLIWDTYAEESVDPITGDDFEGYRIYRSTDPGWNDMQQISDGYGSGRFRKPLAQFDLANGVTGYSALDIEGVHFWLGDDTGLVNSWTDTTCVNGQTYYYAVTAYDRGSDSLGIVPSETAKYISIDKSGEVVDKGTNVGVARPEAPSLGFQEAGLSEMVRSEQSTTTGRIGYEVVDPTVIKNDNEYQVVFEDTIMQNESNLLVQATKNFSLINLTTGETLIDKSTEWEVTQPITEGFIIQLFNPSAGLSLQADSSFWNSDSVYGYTFDPYRYSRTNGIGLAYDYQIEFGQVGIDTSVELAVSTTRVLPPTPVNFKVTNLTTGAPVDFGFYERDVLEGEEGKFTAYTDRTRADEMIFIEPLTPDSTVITWILTLSADPTGVDSMRRNPDAGDVLTIRTVKPFLSNDVFNFTAAGRQVDHNLIKEQMQMIKVVPNPYVVSNSWEPLNPYTNGRGPRELHFTHLPPQCTIKIFNIRGQLVKEIDHNNSDSTADGTEVWNMLSKDEMEIAYGVYIYHVDAGEYGEKVGKFAIIK